MNKKVIPLFLLFLLLTSCQGNAPTQEGGDAEEEDCIIKVDTSIDFLCMADTDYHDNLQAMVDEFEKLEPHVKVRLYNPLGSGDYNAIEQIIVSGFFKEDYPDLAQCYPDNVIKYIGQGYALNLDPFLNDKEYGLSEEEKTDYISTFLEEGTQYHVQGTYSLPFCKSTEVLYYNADALLDLDLSNINPSINNGNPLDVAYLDNLTWEELFDNLCPAIYEYNEALDEDHKIYNNTEESGIFSYDSDQNFFITLAEQYGYGYTHTTEEGKGVLDFNNDEMKALLKKLYDAKDHGYLQTKGSYRDYVSGLFTSKQSLLTVASTAGLTYNFNFNDPFTVGVAKIPHAEGKDYSSINQGPSVCILDHKDENRSLASYLLWKHITDKDNSSAWSLATGYMGIRNSAYETDEYKKETTIEEGASKYDISKASNLFKIRDVRESTFNTAVFRGSSNARSDVGNIMKYVLLGDGKVESIESTFDYYYQDALKYLK